MKTQLVLLLLTLVLFTLFNQNGQSMAFSYATAPNLQRNWAADLYQRAQIWFDKSLDDVEKAVKEGIDGIKNQVKGWKEDLEKADEKKASQEDVDALKKDMGEKLSKAQEQLDELQKAADRIKDSGVDKKSLMQAVEEKATPEFIKAARSAAHGHAAKGLDIDLKAVSIQTTGYSLTGANATLLRAFEMEPGVAKDPTVNLFVQDLIDVGSTSSHTIFWNERVQVEGGAGQTAENTRFPQLSATYAKKSANSKKTAVYTKITEEMQEDVDFILSEIESELLTGPLGMRQTLEAQVLTGDGNGENHWGILPQSTAFAKPADFDTLEDPNNFDVIRAMVLQVEQANYIPTHVILGSAAAANMDLLKDKNGQYIMPPFMSASGTQIAGLRVIKTNRFGAGTVLVCNPSLYRLRIKRNLTLRFFEQNEDDALTDRTTITASLRAVSYIKTPDLKGFVKSTFNAAKALIKTV